MPFFARGVLVILSVLALAVTARGADPAPEPTAPELAFDPATGRDLAHHPPDPAFEHRHMRLEIDIPDPGANRLTAVQTLDVAAVGRTRSQLVLDAQASITIEEVRVDGRPAVLSRDGRRLVVELDPPAVPGRAVQVVTRFRVADAEADGNGLIVHPAKAGVPGAGDSLMFSQGQAEWNSMWFPCHDFPNLRTSTELIVTVPDGYQVLSNGKMISSTLVPEAPASGASPPTTPRRRWHWRQDQPHPYYLVTLVVGRFDVVELGGPDSARPGLPMPVYGPLGSAEQLRTVFADTPRALAFLERLLDEPYPWDQYAQAVVREFRWGGMENTSATTLTDRVLSKELSEQQSLIVHELAHQWIGDLLTCRSWEHVWLNEGWASYIEAVWAGESRGPAAFAERIDEGVKELMKHPIGDALDAVPLVSPLYRAPDDPFEKASNPYTVGMLLLHMLRREVGDEAFWAGTRAYIDGHKFAQVETDDFRRAMEAASGQSLERFFRQWCGRAGWPRLAVDLAWTPATGTAGELSVTIEQVQVIGPTRPAYALRVPIDLALASGERRTINIETDQRSVTRTFALPAAVRGVVVNPGWAVLAETQVRTPLKAAAPPADGQRLDFEQAERARLLELKRRQPAPAGTP